MSNKSTLNALKLQITNNQLKQNQLKEEISSKIDLITMIKTLENQTTVINDILEKNQALNKALGFTVVSILENLNTEVRIGPMTQKQLDTTTESLIALLNATQSLDIDKINEAQRNLTQSCIFSDKIFRNVHQMSGFITSFVVGSALTTLLLLGVSFPPALPLLITIASLFAGAYIGEKAAISYANYQRDSLASKAGFFITNAKKITDLTVTSDLVKEDGVVNN